ncbi:MAG: hypothetical protein HPY75_11995 [Actinobacteria bacterium]|nr:hypothetical protein [Actinomycetota bacterium]
MADRFGQGSGDNLPGGGGTEPGSGENLPDDAGLGLGDNLPGGGGTEPGSGTGVTGGTGTQTLTEGGAVDEIAVDPEALNRLAITLTNEATTLHQLATSIRDTVTSLNWSVPETTTFNANAANFLNAANGTYETMSYLADFLRKTAYAFGFVDRADYWVPYQDLKYSTQPDSEYEWSWTDIFDLANIANFLFDGGVAGLTAFLYRLGGTAAAESLEAAGWVKIGGKVAPAISIITAGYFFIEDSSEDLEKYEGNKYEQGTAIAINAIEGVGSVVLPMMLGAAVGTAICPGLGTAAGLVGGFIVGVAWSVGCYVFNESGAKDWVVENAADVEEWAVENTIDAAEWVGENVADAAEWTAEAAVDAFGSATDAISNFVDDWF